MNDIELKDERITKIKKNVMSYLIEKCKNDNVNPLDLTLNSIKKHFETHYPEDVKHIRAETLQNLDFTNNSTHKSTR